MTPHAVGVIDGKHITMKKSKKAGRFLQLQGLLFPGPPGPGRRRIQVSVETLCIQWFLFRCIYFQQKSFEQEDQGWQLGASIT